MNWIPYLAKIITLKNQCACLKWVYHYNYYLSWKEVRMRPLLAIVCPDFQWDRRSTQYNPSGFCYRARCVWFYQGFTRIGCTTSSKETWAISFNFRNQPADVKIDFFFLKKINVRPFVIVTIRNKIIILETFLLVVASDQSEIKLKLN